MTAQTGPVQRGAHSSVRRLLSRVSSLAPFVVFAVLLVLRWSTLDNPPFWDATWTTAVGASELARTDMDLLALIRAPDFADGGVGTHSTSLYTMALGLLQWGVGPDAWLPAAHVLSVALGAMLFHGTYLLARCFLSQPLSLVTGLAVVALPLTLQQISDIYLDLPIGVSVTYALWAVISRRPGLATLFAFLATGLKPTGLMAVPALPFALPAHRRSPRNALTLMGIAASPVLLYLVRSLALSLTSELSDPLFLARNALVGLGIMPDVLTLVMLSALALRHLRHTLPALALPGGVMLGSFVLLNLASIAVQRSTVLPRYYVAIVPAMMVIVSVALYHRFATRGPLVFLTVLIGFSAVNVTGDWYPVSDHPNPVFVERTLRASEYLDLEVASTRAIATAPLGMRIVDENLRMRLLYPELGYVAAPVKDLTRIAELPRPLPENVAWAVEPHGVQENEYLVSLANEAGLVLDREPVFEGTWTAHLVTATRP